MRRKLKSTKRLLLTSALSALALTALSGIGAGAAQAKPLVWNVEGAPLGGEKAFTLTGPNATFTFQTAGGVTMKCGDVSGIGQIKGPAAGSGLMTWSECAFVGAEKTCQVQPIEMSVNIDVFEKTPSQWVERFSPSKPFKFIVKDPEDTCWWWTENLEFDAKGTSLAAQLPFNLKFSLNLQGLSEYSLGWYYGSEPFTASMEGPISQKLVSGEKFGVSYAP